ncbi:hypothetical protein LKO27_05520 [Tessaracoccus sp. OS52]|uniref:TadE/TadG family type IV pilus assembly protein n=1 Tax=Tessaracoccus sp. OS52 TaxID=2886691 RepID=UPI001D121AE8|nr:hypothetical protein [Tessaracoccus sp. OS52]MCC2592871.1 hypothetical protein [Tessaracoccus sp. OS52]
MHDERGLGGGIQVTLLLPLAISVLLLTLQWALVSWAEATALAAAQDGARVAAAHRSSGGEGRHAAGRAAADGGLQAPSVTVDRGPRLTVVTVTGTAHSVVPGWEPRISRTVEVPTERITQS